MAKSCSGLWEDLMNCLLDSPCVRDAIAGPNAVPVDQAVKNCLHKMADDQPEEFIPARCQGYRQSYFACRRGQVDMRNRFRGNTGY
eukprot:tig00020902_g14953.t1